MTSSEEKTIELPWNRHPVGPDRVVPSQTGPRAQLRRQNTLRDANGIEEQSFGNGASLICSEAFAASTSITEMILAAHSARKHTHDRCLECTPW